jgi:creatinine amidohydrolase
MNRRDSPRVRWWSELTSSQVAALDRDATVAVLPLAAIEQHGPHLPLSTDLDIGLGILEAAFRALNDGTNALALPPQAVGTSMEHEGVPGTLGMAPGLLEESLMELGASLARSGIRRLVIHNSHGGNTSTVNQAGLRLRSTLDMLVIKASYFRFPRPSHVDLSPEEWSHGLHGGAVETAMMLHLRPDLVHTQEIRDFPSTGADMNDSLHHVRPEGYAPFAWMATDLNPDGVTGDARLASAEMGSALVLHYGTILAEIIEDAARFPLDRLFDATDGN